VKDKNATATVEVRDIAELLLEAMGGGNA
jgi:hypothetical protein